LAMIKRCFLLLAGALLAASLVSPKIINWSPLPPRHPAAGGVCRCDRDRGYRITARVALGAKSGSANPFRPAPSPPIAPSSYGLRRALWSASFVSRQPERTAGQTIQPGVYTLRYSNYPVDGAHVGVAPQRDFVLLTPIANDADPNATPAFDALVQMSAKASGTPHPAVLSVETPAGSTFPEVTKEGDHDWVLNVKIGDLPLAIIVAGKYEG